MQIHRLRLVNFRQHESTELEFGPGLTGIVGPNGAGKTTILEAIAWAMYGMPAARGSRDSIRRRGAPPRARVEVLLEFTLGRHEYRIERTLHNAELYQDGEAAPIANSLNAVSEKITRLLGMTRDEFFNTYFTGQKELAVMAAMSAPERAQFLSRVLGYERIRAAQDRLKEARSTLRARLEALRSALPDPAVLETEERAARERLAAAGMAQDTAAAALAAAERSLATARPVWERLQALRETALGLETELRVAEHQARSAAERVERLEHEAAEAGAAQAELDTLLAHVAPLAELRQTAAALDREAEAHAARQRHTAQLDELRARLAAVDERMARLPTAEALAAARDRISAARAALTAATLEAEERRTVWVRDAQDAKTKRQGLLEQYQELREQRQRILKAGPEGDCPTCARPLGAEYEKVLGVLDRQLEDVLFNGNYFKQRIEQLSQEPAELAAADAARLTHERDLADASAELGRLNAQAQDAGAVREERARLESRIRELEAVIAALPPAYDRARHEAVQQEIRALEPLALQAERLRGRAERRARVEAELAEHRAARERDEHRAAELRARRAALEYEEAAYHAARDAEQQADRARRDAELALVRARAEVAAAQEAGAAVARRQAERAEREQEARRTATELAVRQELDRAFTELRTELNATLRPDLSELASGFVRDLTNGRYTDLELDQDYVATLLDDGDPKAVISGGEEDVANLALRLAISQMIAERAGQPLSLLILDEIFGSLDEDRRGAVVDLLRSLADRFPQVILITHIDSVREGFDRVIRVGLDMGRGVSVVRDEPVGGADVAA